MQISIIVILYNPTDKQMEHLRIIAKCYTGVIVDNSQKANITGEQIGLMKYVFNNGNLGIAEAQNIGLRIIIDENNTDYVVFLDQDTRVAPNYPQQIVNEYISLSKHRKLSTLGPCVCDELTGQIYKSAVHKDTTNSDGYINRNAIISSGSVIPVKVLKEVGLNESRLFIDYVDFEWCWRASKYGYQCGITQNVRILHMVGRSEINIGKHKVIISAPFRYYYQYRNHLWLCRKSYVPLHWKLNTGIKNLLRIIYFPFVVKGWASIERNMWKGIYHGIISK